jgi:hypothetical protein
MGFAVPVSDQPFLAQQLDRLVSEIGEPHCIRPNIKTVIRFCVFREVSDVADNGKHLLGFDVGPEYVDVSIDQTIGQHGRQAELEQNPGSSHSHHVPHGQVLSQPCKMFSAFRCGSNLLAFLRVDLMSVSTSATLNSPSQLALPSTGSNFSCRG